MKHIIYIALFLISSLGFAQNNKLFKEATDLYNSGKYQEALDKYQAILNTGEQSAALYYNMGNAHYKLSHIAPSIYYYEKALQLDPNDADIKNNIQFAKNMTIDAIQPTPKTGLQKFKENNLGRYTFDGWAAIAVVFLFLFVACITTYFLVYTSWKKRLFFIVGFVMLIGCGVTVYFAEAQYQDANNSTYAIVYAKESQVNSEPNASASPVFLLHEGTKVKVKSTLNNWKEIQLADGRVGWLPQSDIKKL